MMLTFEVDLGTIELSVNSDSGRIDNVFVGSKDMVESTVEELIVELLGGPHKLSQLISEEEFRLTYNQEKN